MVQELEQCQIRVHIRLNGGKLRVVQRKHISLGDAYKAVVPSKHAADHIVGIITQGTSQHTKGRRIVVAHASAALEKHKRPMRRPVGVVLTEAILLPVVIHIGIICRHIQKCVYERTVLAHILGADLVKYLPDLRVQLREAGGIADLFRGIPDLPGQRNDVLHHLRHLAASGVRVSF